MKLNVLAALFAIGFSGSALAAPTAFTGNEEVAPADCAVLSAAVTLGVSAKVHGAYECAEEDNFVQVAACHEGGSRSTGVACVDSNPDEAGVQLPDGCEGNPTPATSSVPDYKAFFATSNGGVMREIALGTRCNAGSIVGIEGFSE